ncbi:MAG: AraC family transcriptional regulator [Pseudomonadota bacterium]
MDKTTFRIADYIERDEAFHFARKRLATRFPRKAHDHDFYEVFLIENGKTSHWINGTTQTLEAGQLAFLRPNDAHAFCADKGIGCQIINVMFRTETAAHLASRYEQSIGGLFFNSKADLPEIHTLGQARFARAVAVARQLQTSHRSLAGIEEFLLFLTNRVAHHSVSNHHAAPAWFTEACNAAQSPEVFMLGATGFIELAGRSREHVSRTCKAVTGMTPTEYVNGIRIEYAAQLLRTGEASIDEIVSECGFENVSYFYRLFRQQIGSTPKAHRNEYLRDPFQ